MKTNSSRARQAACGLAVVWLAACSPTRSDLSQLQRMPDQSLEARARETVSCAARDLVCARIVQMRGEACALTANGVALAPDARRQRQDCALADARALPGLLPDDAPAADRDRAALMVFDAWRSARDGKNPAASPEALAGAVAALRAMPAGAPYADALAADNLVFGVLSGSASNDVQCADLRQARQQLPPISTGTGLAERVQAIGTAIRSASARRTCA